MLDKLPYRIGAHLEFWQPLHTVGALISEQAYSYVQCT